MMQISPSRLPLYKKTVAVLTLLLLLCTSCERRPLEEEFPAGDYADILLVSDWSLLEEVPTGMTAVFYPVNGGTPTRVMSNNTANNVVRLRKGEYNIIVFNQSENEFGSLSFAGMNSFNTAESDLRPLESGNQNTASDYAWFYSLDEVAAKNLTAYREPEYFNSESVVAYQVTDEMVAEYYAKQKEGVKYYSDTIYVTPPPVVPSLHINIKVKGIQNCRTVKAYITDMAASQYFGIGLNSPKQACQVISSWTKNISELDQTTGTLSASIRTFGVPGMYIKSKNQETRSAYTPTRASQITDEDIQNKLHVFFSLRDGATLLNYNWDVTEDMEYYETELRLNLELDQTKAEGGGGSGGGTGPIVFPDVPDDGKGDDSGGAGFDANVEDWQNKDENIQI